MADTPTRTVGDVTTTAGMQFLFDILIRVAAAAAPFICPVAAQHRDNKVSR